MLDVPVDLIDESFTTVEATDVLLEADLSRARRKQVVDRVAAALILRRWLDAQRGHGGTRRVKREMKRALMVFAVTTRAGADRAWRCVVRIAWKYGDRPGGTAQGKVEIEIPPGAGAGEVADRLAAAGLIGNPAIFRLYAGQRGVASRFKAGKYEINGARDRRGKSWRCW